MADDADFHLAKWEVLEHLEYVESRKKKHQKWLKEFRAPDIPCLPEQADFLLCIQDNLPVKTNR